MGKVGQTVKNLAGIFLPLALAAGCERTYYAQTVDYEPRPQVYVERYYRAVPRVYRHKEARIHREYHPIPRHALRYNPRHSYHPPIRHPHAHHQRNFGIFRHNRRH